MKTRNKIILAAVMASILLSFTACGGNSGDSSASSFENTTSSETS